MDEKRSRSKRSKNVDEGSWDCSVCTYKNSPEAFKCEMCDVRKGTSTRKPVLNPQQLQVTQQYAPAAVKKKPRLSSEKSKDGKNKSKKDKEKASTSGTTPNGSKKFRLPRLKNIDRSSGTSMEVTVGNVTVIITDYKPKKTHSVDTQNNNASSTPAVSPTALPSPPSKAEVNGGDTDSDARS